MGRRVRLIAELVVDVEDLDLLKADRKDIGSDEGLLANLATFLDIVGARPNRGRFPDAYTFKDCTVWYRADLENPTRLKPKYRKQRQRLTE
jgi:hypothetical protein